MTGASASKRCAALASNECRLRRRSANGFGVGPGAEPRGRLPYDLQFRRTRDGAVSAVANPGAAQHYWTFLVDKAQLRLRFLTTFRGNEEPTWLTAEQASSELVRFRGERLPHLRVVVTLRPEEIDISVFLHDRPHVDIELRRGPRQTPGDRTD